MLKRQHVDHLPFRSLVPHEEIQRDLIPALVKRLVREWDLEKVGVLTASVHDGKKARILEGQHRWHAAMELGLGDTKVPCHLYRGLSLEAEAHLALALNANRPWTPYDRFSTGLKANDAVCCGVRDVLARHGLRISRSEADGTVRCVSKAETLYRQDPQLLDETCAVLTQAWGTRPSAVEQVVFTAMGLVLGRYNGELDRGALVKKLGKYRGGPAALVGDARGWAERRPITTTRAAAELIVDTYNKGRRSGQLTPL